MNTSEESFIADAQDERSKYWEVAAYLNRVGGIFEQVTNLLKPSEKVWQPNDFFPNSNSDDFLDRLREFRNAAEHIPPSIIVALVFNMISEEALPNYQAVISKGLYYGDESGTDDHPCAKWVRAWSAEENRHGEVLSRYLFLSGKVDMSAIEVTTQNLIRNGFNPGSQNHLYCGLIYTSFQERVTRVFNQRLSQGANVHGENTLAKICTCISADEARHEIAYKLVVKEILNLDPLGALKALDFMTSKKMSMPGRLMSYGDEKDLALKFAVYAQHHGIQRAMDYPEILDHLIKFWGIESLRGLPSGGAELQERICGLRHRYERIAMRADEMLSRKAEPSFPWLIRTQSKF